MKREELRKYTKHLDKDLACSKAGLDRQMTKQAGLYFYYAVAWNNAVRDEKRSRLRLEMQETKVYRQTSDQHSRVTERMLMSECHLDKSWLKLKQIVNQNAHAADVLKAACQALIHKRDMLVNLGATVRVEMAGEVSTSKP